MMDFFKNAINGLKLVYAEGLLDTWIVYVGALLGGCGLGWFLRASVRREGGAK